MNATQRRRSARQIDSRGEYTSHDWRVVDCEDGRVLAERLTREEAEYQAECWFARDCAVRVERLS